MSTEDLQHDLPRDLQDGLIAVGEAARDLREPWWIFGGAAMALYGLTDIHVPDIDVLCAPRDARNLLGALGGVVIPDPGEGLFRSAVFGRAPDQPILVEVMADLLALLSAKAGSFAVRPIHPFADEPAKRVLVHAIKTGRAPLRLLPPLVLHDRDGAKHTDQAEAILRGEAALDW